MKQILLLTSGLLLLSFGQVLASGSPGEKLFDQKCAMCHIVKGKKGGKIGPELTTIGSSMKEPQLRAKIATPKKSTPGSTMPAFQALPPDDMNALISYLKTLK